MRRNLVGGLSAIRRRLRSTLCEQNVLEQQTCFRLETFHIIIIIIIIISVSFTIASSVPTESIYPPPPKKKKMHKHNAM